MSNKNILVGLTYFYPYISGLSQYALILAEELVKRGNGVMVLTSRYDENLKTNDELGKIKIRRIDGFKLGKGFVMMNWWWEAVRLVKKNDILNLHLPSVENVWLSVLGKIFGKKIIVSYQCEFNSDNIFFDWLVNRWQDVTLLLADKIVVTSLDYINGNRLIQNFKHKVIEIDPPIKVNRNSQKLKLEGKYKIGFLGRISKEKNIELLIKAFDKLPNDYWLYLAGPKITMGEDEYRDKILKKIESKSRIVMLGQVTEPSQFYQSIDCLILSSNNRLESFGMVAAEAIMCGTKVISSNIPGVRVPIKKTGYGEIFKSNDANDLASKIMLIFKNKYQRKYDFDCKKTVDEYEKIF